MFTGIIEEVGAVENITSDKITIKCRNIIEDSKLGDSIAVNGVCLTITGISTDNFCADISEETFSVTNFKDIKRGSSVNLERALTPTTRLGGHIVSGHIDTVGRLSEIVQNNDFYNITIEFDKKFEKYVIKKGSISINGISLTIADVNANRIKLAIIPHTYMNTALKNSKTGDSVNIEFDVLSKYVEKILLSKDNKDITFDLLSESGFC